MALSRALITSLVCTSLLTLSLSYSGIAVGLADVESRSDANWRRGRAPDQNFNAELTKKIEFLQQEVQELRGKVEEQTYQLQQLQAQQKKLYLDLERRLQEGGSKAQSHISSGISFDNDDGNAATKISDPEMSSHSNAALSAPPGSNVNATTPTTQLHAPEEESKVEEKAYQNAYHLIQTRDHDGALVAFQKFVQDFPRGKYLPNAQYWLGEIYLTRGNIDLAAEAFNAVYQNYPQHPKAADSLLKLGYVEYAKGQWKRSQEILNQVKSQYPGSTSAQLANARLQKIQHERH